MFQGQVQDLFLDANFDSGNLKQAEWFGFETVCALTGFVHSKGGAYELWVKKDVEGTEVRVFPLIRVKIAFLFGYQYEANYTTWWHFQATPNRKV